MLNHQPNQSKAAVRILETLLLLGVVAITGCDGTGVVSNNHSSTPSTESLFAHPVAPPAVSVPPPAAPNWPNFTSLFAKPQAPKMTHKTGVPVQFVKKTVKGVPLYETIVDLTDSDTHIAILLANKADEANSAGHTHGDEAFEALVKRAHAAVVMNGTFFSKDDEKRVMGNMVSEGHFLKYSPWENAGTTFGIRVDNRPEMVTAKETGQQPQWNEHWFSLTCGPRLLENGEEWIYPEVEGFTDSHVLGIGPRVALGFNSKGNKLIFVTFVNGLSLKQEAALMKELGCSNAMNLDGGASRSLAHEGQILIPAGRPLTNVIAIYDCKHSAPASLVQAYERFQSGHRPQPSQTMLSRYENDYRTTTYSPFRF
jgi:hypothetical protein